MARGKLWLTTFTQSQKQASCHKVRLNKIVHIVFIVSFLKYTNGQIIKANEIEATVKLSYIQLSPALSSMKTAVVKNWSELAFD